MTRLETRHGALDLPAFLPDATRAVVRALDSADLTAVGVPALMVNTLHIASKPGLSVVRAAGGLHAFMGWPAPIATDSGGYQAYSLLQAGLGSVSSRGFSYSPARGAKKERLDPESCIRKQLRAGSDLLFCLDHCTGPDADAAELRQSVANTVAWARECRAAFDAAPAAGGDRKPLLYAVIQGGRDLALRRECAERLLEIGFDGFGFGGWPIEGSRLSDMVAATAALVPRTYPLHGLGIGKPENVVAAFRAGYSTFDCVIPTRDARHGRLFVFAGGSPGDLDALGFYSPLSLESPRLRRDNGPVEEGCDCPCCTRYSRAYLHHLYAVGDASAARLATLHNLRFYTRLVEALRRE